MFTWTRIDDRRHRFSVGDDTVELETRSLLVHDLVHYAVESEAGLDAGFFGLLSAGTPIAELSAADMDDGRFPELSRVERIVGPIQGLWRSGQRPPGHFFEFVEDELVTPTFVEAVFERLRALTGQWRATPFGGSMILPWPAD